MLSHGLLIAITMTSMLLTHTLSYRKSCAACNAAGHIGLGLGSLLLRGATRRAASSATWHNSVHVPREKLIAIRYDEREATASNYTGPVPANNKPLEPAFVRELMRHMRGAPAKSRARLPPKLYVDAILRASLEQHKGMPFLISLKIPSAEDGLIDGADASTDVSSSSSSSSKSSDVSSSSSGGEAIDYDSAGPSLTLCGDTHGQYCDFADLLLGSPPGADATTYSVSGAGFPSNARQYLFNGDFVDRGPQSVEILLSLLALKLAMPSAVHMLRGNHELSEMNKYYGFEKEVLLKYDNEVLAQLRRLFDLLPLAAAVEQEAFIVHGGLGPLTHNMTLAEIARMQRPSKEYESKIFSAQGRDDLNSSSGAGKNCSTIYNNDKYIEKLREEYLSDLTRCYELLWADPSDEHLGFKVSQRGDSISTFGKDVTATFLRRNGLKYIVRSHEVQMNGFAAHHDGLVYTVFSAPNYCGSVGNLGAVLRLRRGAADAGVSATVYPMLSFAAAKKRAPETVA